MYCTHTHMYLIHMQMEVLGVQQGRGGRGGHGFQVVRIQGLQAGLENQLDLADQQWTHLLDPTGMEMEYLPQ